MPPKIKKNSIYELSRSKHRLELASDWRYFAFFRLLQISPSYRRVHDKLSDGGSTNGLEGVVETYERFGEVWDLPYWEWWFGRAQFHFGVEQASQVTRLGLTEPQKAVSDRVFDNLTNRMATHFSHDLKRMGMPASLLLSVPLVGDKRTLLRRLSALLDEAFRDTMRPSSPAAFPMLRNKIRDKTVDKAIRAVHAQAEFPDETLFSVGVRSRLSPTYASQENREAMTQLVSRQFARALRLSENAASGKFPSLEPIQGVALTRKFDFERLKPLLQGYAQVSADALAEIPIELRTNEANFAGSNRTIMFDDGIMKDLQGRK